MKLLVLVSAPYMVPVIDRFRPFLESEKVSLIVAEVIERLSEEQLMKYASQIDGVMCGDDRFTVRVLEAYAPRLKVLQ